MELGHEGSPVQACRYAEYMEFPVQLFIQLEFAELVFFIHSSWCASEEGGKFTSLKRW